MEELKSIGNHKNAFGYLQIYFHQQTQKRYIEKSITFDNQKRKLELIQALDYIKQNPQVNYLQIVQGHLENKNIFCQVKSFRILTEYFEDTLDDQLRYKQTFNEPKLWTLLIDVLNVMSWESFKREKNCLMHPMTICFSKEENKYKLIHHSLFTETNYILALADGQHFCSPELYCQITLKRQNYIPNNDSSNIYSLALIILKCAFAEKLNLRELYDRTNLKIDQAKLQYYLQKVKNEFSPLLFQVLADMLEEFIFIRADSINLYKFLKDY